MKKLAFTIFIFFSLLQSARAEISDVLVDGSMFTIAGDSFGTPPENSEWLGNDIESGDSGNAFSKTGWDFYSDNQASYTTEKSHSLSKSLLFEFLGDEYDCGMVYDYGQTVTNTYVTFWVYLQKSDTADTFQWKNIRLKNTNGYDVTSGIYGDNWCYDWNTDPRWGNVSFLVQRNNYVDGSETRTVPDDGYVFGEWQRIEAYYKTSSSIGAEDGVFEIRRVGRYGGEIIASNYGVLTHDETNSDQLYRYLMLGHYYGNLKNADGTDWVGVRDMKIYYDDIYLSQSRKRVEIGNDAVFAACTHREIQPALTWSDTGITGTLNKGSFNNGDTVYFFVIDEDGVPSDGYPVTIGGDPSIANPVVEILTEAGQTTTASVFTITGTATADTDQTISGVTCSGQTVTPDDGTWDEQSEAFTCLASLAIGENTLLFIGSDGTRTGQDSISVTRTEAENISKIHGKSVIKNAIIH